MPDNSAKIDRILHALGDPTRRAIVERLSHGPNSVTRLAEPLNITVTAVAQHLQILEESGLVQTQKVGRVRTCNLERRGFTVLEKWLLSVRTEWERRMDRLDALLSSD